MSRIFRSKLLVVLIVLYFSLVCAVSADIGVSYPIGSDFEVVLLDVVYDELEDEQTWHYRITCYADAAHDISHFVFEFAEVCDPPLTSIIDAGPGDPEISSDYSNTFPQEGVAGIKFDTSVLKDNSVEVWFTLDGQWVDGTMGFWIKAGEPVFSGTIEGPDCTQVQLCDVYLSTFPSATSWMIVEGPGLPPGGILVDDYNPNQELLYGETYTVTSNVPNGYEFLYWEASGNIELSSTSTNPTEMTVLCGGSLAAYIRRLERDVAAIAQIAFETKVEPGTPVEIVVTVANYGDVPESFDVTCYFDDTEIDTIRVSDLGPGDTKDVVFTWDTGGVPLNTYLIEAWADSGEEIEELEAEDNNWCTMRLPVFVIPELPLGTVMVLLSMIVSLILFQRKGYRLMNI